jgi:hypothetical protein
MKSNLIIFSNYLPVGRNIQYSPNPTFGIWKRVKCSILCRTYAAIPLFIIKLLQWLSCWIYAIFAVKNCLVYRRVKVKKATWEMCPVYRFNRVITGGNSRENIFMLRLVFILLYSSRCQHKRNTTWRENAIYISCHLRYLTVPIMQGSALCIFNFTFLSFQQMHKLVENLDRQRVCLNMFR